MSSSRSAGAAGAPARGDYVAWATCLVALAVYAAAFFMLRGQLHLGSPVAGALYVVANLSVAVTVACLGWTLLHDVPRLGREESATQVLLDVEEEGEPPEENRLAEGRTLAGALVARVERAAPGSRVPGAGELRMIALASTASLGGVARYGAQLLLLLTVLGTFLGVRDALPGLIRALQAEDPAMGLDSALTAVVNAFGSNLGALLGAIALGLATFGLGAGRSALLARLELASVRSIYPALERRTAVRADTEMMRELQTATTRLGELAELARLPGVMRELKDEVALAGGQTAQLLERVLKQERRDVQDQAREQVARLEGLVSDVVTTVQANAGQYEGIASALAGRAQDFDAALTKIGSVVTELATISDRSAANLKGMTADVGRALKAVAEAVQGAGGTSGEIRDHLVAARDELVLLATRAAELASGLALAETAASAARDEAARRDREAAAALHGRHAQAMADAEARQQRALAVLQGEQAAASAAAEARQVEALEVLQRESAGMLAAAEARQREILGQVEAELVTLVAERIASPLAGLRVSVQALQESVQAVRGSTEKGVLAAFQQARSERMGVGADDLTAALDRVSQRVEGLDEPAGQLVGALHDLTVRIQEIEARLARPWWKRMMTREPAPTGGARSWLRRRNGGSRGPDRGGPDDAVPDPFDPDGTRAANVMGRPLLAPPRVPDEPLASPDGVDAIAAEVDGAPFATLDERPHTEEGGHGAASAGRGSEPAVGDVVSAPGATDGERAEPSGLAVSYDAEGESEPGSEPEEDGEDELRSVAGEHPVDEPDPIVHEDGAGEPGSVADAHGDGEPNSVIDEYGRGEPVSVAEEQGEREPDSAAAQFREGEPGSYASLEERAEPAPAEDSPSEGDDGEAARVMDRVAVPDADARLDHPDVLLPGRVPDPDSEEAAEDAPAADLAAPPTVEGHRGGSEP